MPRQIPVIQIVGYKNSGKTHLICRLIPRLVELGFRVGTIKHDAHGFDIDREDRDTWRHRTAGAEVVAITSAKQTAVIESRARQLSELAERVSGVDLILAEGFKSSDLYPKIVLLRNTGDGELIDNLSHVKAVAAAASLARRINRASLPVIDRDDTETLLHLVLDIINERRLPE